jgi:hypothetical protein
MTRSRRCLQASLAVGTVRLRERELARQRLTAALELRERLGHGHVEETRRGDEQVLGLEITMDDISLVGGGEPASESWGRL